MTDLRAGADSVDGDARLALIDERDHLLASIRDLDAELDAGDIDPADHARLRDDYTARAAAVLRAIDALDRPQRTGAGGSGAGGSTAPTGIARAHAGGRTRRPPVVTAAVVVAVALAAAGAGLLTARSAGERLPGQEATGDIVRGSGDRIAQAQALAAEGRVLEAIKLYDEALASDPENPVALAQRGWLVSRAGLGREGLDTIERAIEIDPAYPDAWFFKAMIHWRLTDEPEEARAAFERLLELDAPQPLLDFVRDEALPALAAGAAPPTEPGP